MRENFAQKVKNRIKTIAVLAIILAITVSAPAIALKTLAAEGQTFTLLIEYKDQNTGEEIAAPYKAVLKPGDTYSVSSPQIEGYSLVDSAQETVSGEISSDVQYEVVYSPGELTFSVHHYFKTVDGIYVMDESLDETVTAERNTVVTVTPAAVDGYECISDTTVYVPTTGTVDKDLYYEPTDGKTVIYFETGSTYVPYISETPGTDITAEKAKRVPGGSLAPSKAGYVFAGWTDEDGNDAEIPDSMPDQNMKLIAKWTPGESKYTVVYRFRNYYSSRYTWDGKATGAPEYYDFMSVQKTGTTGSEITYDWNSEDASVKEEIQDAFYEYESAETGKTISADGNTVEYVYCQPVKVKLYLYSFWHMRLDVDENGEHTGTYDKGYMTKLWGDSPLELRLGDYIPLPTKEELFDQTIEYNGKTFTCWDLIFFNYSLPNSPQNSQDKYSIFWPYSNYAFAENFNSPPSTNMISEHPFITESMLDQTVVPGDPSTYHNDPFVKESTDEEDYSDTWRNGSSVEKNYDDTSGSYVVSISPYYTLNELHDFYIRYYHENPNKTEATAEADDRVITDTVNGVEVTKVYEPASYYHYQDTDDVLYMYPMFVQGHMLEYYARINSGISFDPDGTPPELTDTNYRISAANQPYDSTDPAEKQKFWLQNRTGRIYLELYYSCKTYPVTFLDGSEVLAENRPSDEQWPADSSKGGYEYKKLIDLNETYRSLSGGEDPEPPEGMEDYTFGGWYAEGDTDETVLNEVSVERAENRYVAKWIAPKYTVTFDSNGGSSVDSQKVDKNSTAERPADPVREGYEFIGWFYKDDLAWYEFDMPVVQDTELIALWDKNDDTVDYTVTHQLQKADGTVSTILTEDRTYSDYFAEYDSNSDHYVTARALYNGEEGYPEGTYTSPLAAALLFESGERNITFNYLEYPEYTYIIRYVDKETGEEIAERRTITDTAQIMTASAIDIDGYEPLPDSEYGQADKDGDRVITLYYTSTSAQSETDDSPSPDTGDTSRADEAMLLMAFSAAAAALTAYRRIVSKSVNDK